MRRACALLLLLLLAGAASAAPKHLIFIAIDTLRADRLGCYGHERPTSPTLDALAARGVLFERAIAPAPWTLPSFASMFSGRLPTRHGAGLHGELRQLGQDAPSPLPPELPTLTSALRARGYRCAAFTTNPYLRLGLQRGFEPFFCRTVRAEQVGALARAHIAQMDPAEPQFLFLHFNDPHEPTNPADPYLRAVGAADPQIADPRRASLERWGAGEHALGRAASVQAVQSALATKLALYDGAILRVDREVSRILRALERRGLLEDALVVLTSDHGEEFLEHLEAGRAADEDPRQLHGIGHGHTLYDELLHVPLILVGPGLPAGQRIAEQLSLVDLMPTLLGLLGLAPPDAGLDGQDRSAWIRDPQRAPLWAFAESIAYGVDRIALRTADRKLILDRFGRPFACFDLLADPGEQRPLGEIPAELAAELLRASERWAQDAPPRLDPAAMDPQMLEGLRSLGYMR